MRARRRDRTTAATPLSLDVPSTGGRHQRHVELIDSDSAVTFPIVGAVTTPRLSSIIFSVMLRTTEKILFIELQHVIEAGARRSQDLGHVAHDKLDLVHPAPRDHFAVFVERRLTADEQPWAAAQTLAVGSR